MAVRFIIDSASDYTQEEAQREGLEFIPMGITFGEDSFRAGVDLTTDEFYRRLEEGTELPVSSRPTPKELLDLYSRIVDEGDEGIYLTMASSLSGTYQMAKMLAEQFEGKITVIDSTTVTIAQRLLLNRARMDAASGMSTKELVDAIYDHIQHLYLFGYLDTMEYLKRGGRISPALNLIAGLFSVKPVVYVHKNELGLASKARGRKNGLKAMARILQESKIEKPEMMLWAYSGPDDLTEAFFAEYPEFRVGTERVYQLGSTIGTHVGEGAMGVAVFLEEER